MSRPGFSSAICAAISPVVYICATPGDSSSPFSCKGLAPVVLCRHHPVLLAGGVQIVTTGGQRGLDHLRPVLDERTDHVAHHAGAGEQLGQRLDRVLDLDHFVVGGLDARHLVDHLLDAVLVPAGGDERHVVLAQVLADQTSGVAGDTVDNNRFGSHRIHCPSSVFTNPAFALRSSKMSVAPLPLRSSDYMPIPPSTGRPRP